MHHLHLLPEIPETAELIIALVLYLLIGGKILLKAGRNILHGDFFDENFLMCVATIGAFALGEYHEAVMVMLLYRIGEWLQDKAVDRSRRSIAGLMDIRPDYANIEKDGELVKVDPEEVEVGSVITVLPGERIPVDGIVAEGTSRIDTAALTGEALPADVSEGSEVYSGSINLNGLLKIRVTKPASESTANRILELVEEAADSKGKAEAFITRFARIYTPVVCALAAFVMIVPPLVLGGGWSTWVHRGLTFLIISCPCALVISVPLSFFGGIGGASAKGILIKGGNYLEALAKADAVLFDKTGTITRGVFTVVAIHPEHIEEDGHFICDCEHEESCEHEHHHDHVHGSAEDGGLHPTEGRLLELAALAESFSNHPIASSLAEAYGQKIDKSRVTDAEEIAGKGISATVDGLRVSCGNRKMMDAVGVPYHECTVPGTAVHVAVDGKYVGHIIISDKVKEDAKRAIEELRAEGVSRIAMLTGDKEEMARSVADAVGIGEYRFDLLPQDKLAYTEKLIAELPQKKTLAFVGDGINDAPVLAKADVGIAMGGMGSAAAVEAADIVLMNDKPSDVALAVRHSRKVMRIIYEDIVFSLGVKVLVLILAAAGYDSMWMAVFADVGVCMIAILNSMRTLNVK